MKIMITDETIRCNVTDAVKECEEEKWISFPDNSARSELIDECMETIVASYETSEYYASVYNPDYMTIVLDNAELYGYCTP